ncbi:hypothetical protein E2C01_018969 [Portunus trituberculatus]|uniref:Uncharacterized protein n=1 Tax=Portunus trituberculatus TaxID=210409 RepID=A0A5B7DXX4_PORTR|nr:hypothetical protein [Portunus trituberculatus]
MGVGAPVGAMYTPPGIPNIPGEGWGWAGNQLVLMWNWKQWKEWSELWGVPEILRKDLIHLMVQQSSRRHSPNPNKSCVALEDADVAEEEEVVAVAFLTPVLGEGEELLLPGAFGRGLGEALVPRLLELLTNAELDAASICTMT